MAQQVIFSNEVGVLLFRAGAYEEPERRFLPFKTFQDNGTGTEYPALQHHVEAELKVYLAEAYNTWIFVLNKIHKAVVSLEDHRCYLADKTSNAGIGSSIGWRQRPRLRLKSGINRHELITLLRTLNSDLAKLREQVSEIQQPADHPKDRKRPSTKGDSQHISFGHIQQTIQAVDQCLATIASACQSTI